MLKQFASIVLLLASGTQVLAFEALKIEGTAFLDEEACTKSGNCNLTFKIGGEMAKVIYDGMGTAARTNGKLADSTKRIVPECPATRMMRTTAAVSDMISGSGHSACR
jgi:hypothetical protein